MQCLLTDFLSAYATFHDWLITTTSKVLAPSHLGTGTTHYNTPVADNPSPYLRSFMPNAMKAVSTRAGKNIRHDCVADCVGEFEKVLQGYQPECADDSRCFSTAARIVVECCLDVEPGFQPHEVPRYIGRPLRLRLPDQAFGFVWCGCILICRKKLRHETKLSLPKQPSCLDPG